VGIAIFVVATWQFSYLNMRSGYWDLFWPQVGRGIGLGLIFVPLSSATLGSISIAKTASASGLYNLVRQLGGSAGIALLTLMLQHLEAFHWRQLAGANLSSVSKGAISSSGEPSAIASLSDAVHQQAAVLAYNDLFRYSALIFATAYLPLLFLKVKRTSRQHTSTPLE
jgi:DHA2 family multidrug resistance protein